MIGWTFDAGARKTCDLFGAMLGHVPYACMTNGGRPFVIMIAAALVFALCLFIVVRAYRTS